MCWNLYQQLCYCRGEVPALKPEELEEQLLFIQRAFLQLRAINELAKRNMAQENASMPSNTLPEDLTVQAALAGPNVELKIVPKILISAD